MKSKQVYGIVHDALDVKTTTSITPVYSVLTSGQCTGDHATCTVGVEESGRLERGEGGGVVTRKRILRPRVTAKGVAWACHMPVPLVYPCVTV